MKPEILLELADRWMRDAQGPDTQCVSDNSPESKLKDGLLIGHREGKRECADALRSLVQILG